MWALRCASAERIDFFEASIVRRKNGVVEVRGGNVRDPYAPDEVWFVKPASVDAVRGFVRETEAAARAATTNGDEFARARARDDASKDMVGRLARLLKEHCLPMCAHLGVPRREFQR